MPTAPPQRPVAKKRRFPRSFGRYVLEKTLSRGGMGEVYLAIVKRLRQRCVIKTIRGDLTGEEEFVGRFADEAKILVRASHDNIIRYFDAGRVGEDYYIAMEFVHGRDLGDVLDRAYERGAPMPAALGLYVASKLLSGLHYAHEMKDETGRRMGLVHRDISPQNVLIGFDGSVKLIDFGLARTDVLPNRTQGALAVGKYGYMSPEQARHQPLDGRADIYSSGVMLFEVFTGDRLVDEQDQSTLWQRVLSPQHRRPRTVVPDLPWAIDDLVMKAVAVQPEDRFANAQAMAHTVNDLRGPDSTRDELKNYLRYLYPRVDFAAPPLPDLVDVEDSVEQSLIFATSRDGARSVFGRGELPIEGTMQLNAKDVLREIEKRRKDGNKTKPPSPTRATPLVDAMTPAPQGRRGAADNQPTQITRFPDDEEATAYMTAPVDVSSSSKDGLLGRSGLAASFGEEERTVMMKAPPQAAFKPPKAEEVFDAGAPNAPLFSEDTATEATQLAVVPKHASFDEPKQNRPGQPQRIEPPSVSDPALGYKRVQDSTPPPLEGPSIFLIGGLVFAVAALLVVAGLLIAR